MRGTPVARRRGAGLAGLLFLSRAPTPKQPSHTPRLVAAEARILVGVEAAVALAEDRLAAAAAADADALVNQVLLRVIVRGWV